MTLEIDVFDVIAKNKSILLHPKSFMLALSKEKGKKSAFSFFATTSLAGNIVGITGLLLLFPLLTKMVPQVGYEFAALEDIPKNLIFLLFAYLLGLLGSFVYAGFLLFLLKVFTKKATFNRTYRLYVYSWAPSLLLGWVPIVGIAIHLYSLVLFALGLGSVYKFSFKKTLLFMLTLIMILFFLNSTIETLAINQTLQ